MCKTLVFAGSRYYVLGNGLAALPCLASCANLQIAHYSDAFFTPKAHSNGCSARMPRLLE